MYQEGNSLSSHGYAGSSREPEISTNPTHGMLQDLYQVFQNYYKITNPTSITEDLGQIITNGTAYSVVDGSYDPRKLLGTACWVLTEDSHRIKGAAQAPGSLEEMYPYMAELFGIYCLLLFIKLYREFYEINSGKVELACDCLSAVTKSLMNDRLSKVSAKHHDLLLAIYELRTKSPITLDLRQVYGHQDTKNRPLDKWEQLN